MSAVKYNNIATAQLKTISEALNSTFDAQKASALLNAFEAILSLVPGANVPAATTSARGTVLRAAAVANAAAAPTQAEFNALLTSFRNAGQLAP